MIPPAVLRRRSALLWLWVGMFSFYLPFFLLVALAAFGVTLSRSEVEYDTGSAILGGACLVGIVAGWFSLLLVRRWLISLPSKALGDESANKAHST